MLNSPGYRHTGRDCWETLTSHGLPSDGVLFQTAVLKNKTTKKKRSDIWMLGYFCKFQNCHGLPAFMAIVYQSVKPVLCSPYNLKLTLDPVHPSSANANWLIGETTRSTLTALHGLDSWFCWVWLTACKPDAGFGSSEASPLLSSDVSVPLLPSLMSSLKIEKHLSKRSMLEEGWAGPSSDSK